MQLWQMKEEIIKAWKPACLPACGSLPKEAWRYKVNKMPAKQVQAIWFRFKKQGLLR